MTKLRVLFRLALFMWRHPDWRFCQTVVNVADRNDPFYVKDDDFLRRLKEYRL